MIYSDKLSRWFIQINYPDTLLRIIFLPIFILGVRFETGVSELQISNRVENVKRKTSSNSRIFTKARVNIKLSLGQIIRDTVYFEAESQFQSQAYFKTTIQMSNAIQGGGNDEKSSDVIHINLIRYHSYIMYIITWRGKGQSENGNIYLFYLLSLQYIPCEPAMLSRQKLSGDPPETLWRGSRGGFRGVSGYFV